MTVGRLTVSRASTIRSTRKITSTSDEEARRLPRTIRRWRLMTAPIEPGRGEGSTMMPNTSAVADRGRRQAVGIFFAEQRKDRPAAEHRKSAQGGEYSTSTPKYQFVVTLHQEHHRGAERQQRAELDHEGLAVVVGHVAADHEQQHLGQSHHRADDGAGRRRHVLHGDERRHHPGGCARECGSAGGMMPRPADRYPLLAEDFGDGHMRARRFVLPG